MTGLLAGVRVLDVSMASPGMTGMHLADLGAEVIKVERPGQGDYIRHADQGPGDPVSINHRHWNRGKRGLALDLQSPAGAAVFCDLALTADAVIEGLRPGTLDRWGVGYDVLRATRPSLVFASVSGFGASGPYRDLPAHGFLFDAWAGAADPVPGPEGLPSIPPHTHVGGVAGPLFAALGVVAAILRARTTGEGCRVELAQADVSWYWNAVELANAERSDRRVAAGLPPDRLLTGSETGEAWVFGDTARYQYYETSDQRCVLFMAMEAKFWARFAVAVDRADLVERFPGDPRGDVAIGDLELRRELAAIFATRSQGEWVTLFREANVPGGPVHRGTEIRDDPHFLARTRWLTSDEPDMPMLASPLRVDPPGPDPSRAPMLGEHTDAILRDLPGYDDARIEELRAAGVIPTFLAH